jgi:DNA-binding cell septation regulator SpoVG
MEESLYVLESLQKTIKEEANHIAHLMNTEEKEKIRKAINSLDEIYGCLEDIDCEVNHRYENSQSTF